MRRKALSKAPLSSNQAFALTPEEELELDFNVCCSIEEIENILSKNASEKQKKLAEISLKILRNPQETFIKKKQVMRQWFGDYKQKFESKKKQMVVNLNNNKCDFKKTEGTVKSVCFRKHEGKSVRKAISNSENLTNLDALDGENSFSFKPSDNSFKFAF